MRFISYVRTSSKKQKDNSSPYTQHLDNKAYAESQGWTLVEDVTDNQSGFEFKNRVGLKRIISLVSDGRADVVVAWDISRSGRDDYELEKFIETLYDLGGKLAISSERTAYDTADETIDHNFWQMKASNYEARRTRKRTEAGKLRHIERGSFTRSPNYGYTLVKKRVDGVAVAVPVIDEYDAQVIRLIFDLYEEGLSYSAIARHLNTNGYRHKRKQISFSERLVATTLNKHLDKYAGKPFPGTWTIGNKTHTVTYNYPPIISDERYKRLKRLQTTKGKSFKEKLPTPYKGLVRCTCGGSVNLSLRRQMNYGTLYRLKCSSHNLAGSRRRQGKAEPDTYCHHGLNVRYINQKLLAFLSNTKNNFVNKLEEQLSYNISNYQSMQECMNNYADEREGLITQKKALDAKLVALVGHKDFDVLSESIADSLREVRAKLDTINEGIDECQRYLDHWEHRMSLFSASPPEENFSKRPEVIKVYIRKQAAVAFKKLNALKQAVDTEDWETVNELTYALGIRIRSNFSKPMKSLDAVFVGFDFKHLREQHQTTNGTDFYPNPQPYLLPATDVGVNDGRVGPRSRSRRTW